MFAQRLLARAFSRAPGSQYNPFSSPIFHQQPFSAVTPVQLLCEKVPPKPKKPLSKWLLFVRDRKNELLRNQKMSAVELVKALSKEYINFDKTIYDTEYNQLEAEYLKALKTYNEALTPEQKQLMAEAQTERKAERTRRELNRTKPPKGPRTPSNLFFMERLQDPDIREKMSPSTKLEIFSSIFNEYRNLSDEERERYLQMQEDDKERFRLEFQTWYDGVMKNESLSRRARDRAKAMRTRFKLRSLV